MSEYTVDSGFIRDDEYIKFKPLNIWPSGTHFQLGKSKNKCRIEAYPPGYYITSFEDTLEEAEEELFKRYTKISKCNHLTARRKWNNGGGICLKCKEFVPNAFKPVYEMKNGIYQICIDHLITLSLMLPYNDIDFFKYKNDYYTRRQYLILRLSGFKVPDIKNYDNRRTYIKDYINSFEKTLNENLYNKKYFFSYSRKPINQCFEQLKEEIISLKEEMEL